jgi:serine/threonine protein kinase
MTRSYIHRDLPDEEIIAHCWSPNAQFIGDTDKLGRRVVQIGDDAVVKFGCSVKRFEFENLKIAKTLVDPSVVYIPKVYRFFTDDEGKRGYWGDRGYILMEYVHGIKADPIETPDLVQRIALIVAHFASIRGDIPGTLSRGPCNGILFPDCDEFTFDTVQAMEDFFNRRIFPHQVSKINLKNIDLVLCHLDIAPRNILWKDDGSICFLDWASAGFYPRCFEFAAQLYLLGFEGNFNQMLIDAIMPPLSKEEQAVSMGVIVARGNSERYTL